MKALTEEEELELVIRYKLRSSTLQLAERFEVDERTVRRVLDRHGVPRRPRQEKAPVTPLDVAALRAQGHTFEEIAEILAVSYSTVRNRYREWLEEEVHCPVGA